MAFNYDITTDVGKVRLRYGDTVETDASLADAEVQVAIDETNNLRAAAVRALEYKIAKLTDYVTRSELGISSQQGEKLEKAEKLLKILKQRAAGRMVGYVGGIDKDRIEDAKDDADYEQPFARMKMDDHKGTDPVDNDS